jgi:hypothetical protein
MAAVMAIVAELGPQKITIHAPTLDEAKAVKRETEEGLGRGGWRS